MKKHLAFVFTVVFLVLVLWLLFDPAAFGLPADLFGNVTPTSILEVLKELDPVQATIWLSFAVFAKLLGILAGVYRWQLLLKGQGIKLPLWYLAKVWFVGRTIGFIIPAGPVGLDGYRVVESAMYTREPIKCATVIAVEKLISIVALGLLVFLTLPLVLVSFDVNIVMLGAVLAVLFVFIAVSFLLLMNPRIIQVLVAVLPVPGKLRAVVNKLGVAITAYSGQRFLLVAAVFFGLCIHLGACLMYFGTAMAITGGTSSFVDILFASPLVIVATIIAPTVGRVGVREAVMAMLLGGKYGGAEAALLGHLGIWVGEMAPFLLSLPLILLVKRPSKEKFLAEVQEVREATATSTVSLNLPPEVVADYRAKLFSCLLAGIFAGLIGGALYGLGEAAWHMSLISDIQDTSAYWWAPLVYGIVLVPLGIGIAAALVFLYLLFDRFAPTAVTFGLCLGGTLAVLVVGLGRFKYQRDVLGEHAMAMKDNLLLLGTAAGIGLVAVIAGALVLRMFRGGWARAALAGVAAYILIILVGIGVASMTIPEAQALAFKPAKSATGPNVVLIAVDTLRADYLTVFNEAATPKTPNISKFSQDALRFPNTFAQSSWTKASFGTIFSGMYPEAHTATGKVSALPDEITTIAEALETGGYFTKGYSNNPNITGVWNYDQGFVDYVDLKPNLYFGARDSSEKLVLYDILRKVVNVFYAKVLGGRINITDYYQPGDVVTDTGLGWVDSAERPDDAPFFLFLHYMDPHDPFRDPERPGKGYSRAQMANPDPEEFLDAFKRSYSYEVEYMDEHVGRLLDGLKQRGLYDDALIVFTSDHGEEFYEHGGWWHGLSLYDEQIAIPLLVKLPANQFGGQTNPGLARHVDLAPTVAQLAKVDPGPKWQGQSLFTAELQPGNAATEFVYSHLDFEGILLHSMRTADTKLIQANEGNKRNYAPVELYDLKADPGEKTNLASDAARAQVLQQLTDTIFRMQGHILENRAQPSLSEEGMDQMKEQLESLGYLGK